VRITRAGIPRSIVPYAVRVISMGPDLPGGPSHLSGAVPTGCETGATDLKVRVRLPIEGLNL
jgi:hypothetical protein